MKEKVFRLSICIVRSSILNKKKLFFAIVAMLTCLSVYSQTAEDNFTVHIRGDEGDLNNDGLEDRVIVMMDTIHDTRPLRLQIFFSQSDGSYDLVASSTKIIEAQYPVELEGKHNGHTIPDFFIEDGLLHMECYVKGTSVHEFKFNKGKFELIQFSSVVWDGKDKTTESTLDLLTGKYFEQSQMLGSEDYIDRVEKNIKINPLPIIQDFIPFENELY